MLQVSLCTGQHERQSWKPWGEPPVCRNQDGKLECLPARIEPPDRLEAVRRLDPRGRHSIPVLIPANRSLTQGFQDCAFEQTLHKIHLVGIIVQRPGNVRMPGGSLLDGGFDVLPL